MRSTVRTALATTAVVGLLAIPVAGASAADQVITGTVGGTVTIDSAPADKDLGTLPAAAVSLGSITVSSNVAYTLTLQADKDAMTVHDGTNYSTDADETLDTALLISATNGTPTTGGVGLLAVPATTTAAPLATNALSALLSTTDVYTLTATQAVTALDPAGAYRIEATYTATSGLPS